MVTKELDVGEVARHSVNGNPIDALLDRLIERVGGRASVQAVFGEPIQRGDLTVVPVAKVRWAFGGGAGTGPAETEASGSGAGGGVMADPAGYLEIRGDEARFRPIGPAFPSPALVIAGGLTAAIVFGALARLVKR
jgi:hypothetical protein